MEEELRESYLNYRRIYEKNRYDRIKKGEWKPKQQRSREGYMTAPIATKSPITEDLWWCAGFLEAEGCFLGSPSLNVSASQKEPELLERLQVFFGGSIGYYKKSGHWCHEWRAYGPRAHGIMLTLYSMLSIKRQNQIRKALNKPPIPNYVLPSVLTPSSVVQDGKIVCKKCGNPKEVSEFPKSKNGNPIFECRECKKKYNSERHKAVKSGTWKSGKQGTSGQKEETPKPTVVPNVNDIAWAAGFLDGEATFRFKSSYEIRCPQVNQEPLYRLQVLFGGSIKTTKKISHWTLYGESAVELIRIILPILSQNRQEQIQQTVQG